MTPWPAILPLGFVLLAVPHPQGASVPARPAPPAASFEETARRADAARQAGRLDEAVALYREGLVQRPGWPEGLWAIGAIAYDRDQFEECRDAFARLVGVEPGMGPAWALRGLCEFRLGAYGAAREHVEEGLSFGMPPSDTVTRVVLYHQALLLVRESKFDLAIAPLRSILQFQAATPELELACGLVLLRRPVLPQAIGESSADLVKKAGKAYCAHLARHPEVAGPLFEALIAKHPHERYLHYGYGLTLAQAGSAEAVEQYRREIELFPDDVLARVELAFALLTQGREGEAVAPAEMAARLAPGLFVTHLVLGRALAATGHVERAIPELQMAVAMAPGLPEVHLALARAYAQAGRRAEADRANATFRELESARRGAAGPKEP